MPNVYLNFPMMLAKALEEITFLLPSRGRDLNQEFDNQENS